MGVETFYIGVIVDKDSAESLKKTYKEHSIYSDVFNCANLKVLSENKILVGMESVIENFMMANSLIFELLNKFSNHSKSFDIITLNAEKHWDFQSRRDFMIFMYDVWERKIEHLYEQYGTIVISPKRYWKTRSRLYKNYYKKKI